MSRTHAFATLALLTALAPLRADLHFEQPTAQLGDIFSGRLLRQVFAFTNQGPSVVRILRLNAACGCMTPKLDKEVYQPGEGGSFVLDVNTLTQPAGKNRWHVDVSYQDGQEPKMRQLAVVANLLSEIKVEPARLALSTTGPLSHDIVITDLRTLPLCVLDVATGTPHVSATVSVNDRMNRIRVEVKESLPEGVHEGMLSIVTDDAKYRELRVPISIVKRTATGVSAAPSAVNVNLSKGQSGSRMVLLRSAADRAVVVEKAESDNPAVSCRWATGPGKMATLRVSIDGAKATETHKGTVRVFLRGASPGPVVIPVSWVVR